MNKCSPVEMRKSLELSDAMKNAMIRFIPIPVMNEDDYIVLMSILKTRLNIIELDCIKIKENPRSK